MSNSKHGMINDTDGETTRSCVVATGDLHGRNWCARELDK